MPSPSPSPIPSSPSPSNPRHPPSHRQYEMSLLRCSRSLTDGIQPLSACGFSGVVVDSKCHERPSINPCPHLHNYRVNSQRFDVSIGCPRTDCHLNIQIHVVSQSWRSITSLNSMKSIHHSTRRCANRSCHVRLDKRSNPFAKPQLGGFCQSNLAPTHAFLTLASCPKAL